MSFTIAEQLQNNNELPRPGKTPKTRSEYVFRKPRH